MNVGTGWKIAIGLGLTGAILAGITSTIALVGMVKAARAAK